MLPDHPASAPWLSRDEAVARERRLAAEEYAPGNGHGAGAFRSVLADRQIWLAILVYFCHQLTIYTVILRACATATSGAPTTSAA